MFENVVYIVQIIQIRNDFHTINKIQYSLIAIKSVFSFYLLGAPHFAALLNAPHRTNCKVRMHMQA